MAWTKRVSKSLRFVLNEIYLDPSFFLASSPFVVRVSNDANPDIFSRVGRFEVFSTEPGIGKVLVLSSDLIINTSTMYEPYGQLFHIRLNVRYRTSKPLLLEIWSNS